MYKQTEKIKKFKYSDKRLSVGTLTLQFNPI